MSGIYLTEPPTQGKVLIKTTFGDIDVELWSKEAPLACRNFIQLALEGYYDSTIVHRIVKGFMIQMGDPTGTGTGGKSIWGRPFKDEQHGRIKFNHRGQVAMANESAPNTNQSQFFVTLDACEWLNGKHTIFGKVTGNTIFNVLRLGEVEVGGEGGDRPTEELKIKGIEVLWNPFEDIVPRDLSKSKVGIEANKPVEKAKNIKAVKDKKLLSFGNEEDEEENGPQFSIKMKSSHDTKSKGKKSKSSSAADANTTDTGANPSAASALSKYGDSSAVGSAGRGGGSGDIIPSRSASVAEDRDNIDSEGEGGGVNQAADFDRMMRSELIKKRQNELAAESALLSKSSQNNNSQFPSSDETLLMDRDTMQDAVNDSKRSGQIKDKTDTYKKLKEDLLRSRRAVNVMMGTDAAKLQEESAFKELVSPLEQRRLKYMKRKSEHGDRSEETMEKLKKFTSAIRSTKQEFSKTINSAEEGSSGTSAEENYHGQVLETDDRDVDPEREKRDLQTWFVGKLKCKKHIDDTYRNEAGKPSAQVSADGHYTDDYMVIDPRSQRSR